MNPTIARLNTYGARLYAELEALTGQPSGYHRVGNLRVATHPDRLDEFRRYLGIAEISGIKAELLGPAQINEIWPIMNLDGVLGGLLNPLDGHIAPADLTQSFAIGARGLGAKIMRNTVVSGFTRMSSGEWAVHTSNGDITCEHVVSCTGNYGMQTASMLGLPSQAMSVKHEYLVTDPIPELEERRKAGLPELPVMRDPEEMFYMRQEGDSFVMGCYEGRGECVFTGGVPATFGMELFADELDKLLPFMEKAIERVPLLETAGIRRVVNGPQPYTPDDLPITGPAFGAKNFWLGEGNPFGVTLAGGIGWQLSEWIVEGAPSIDMSACDPQRFGGHATRNWSARKTEEAYERTYLVPKPGEEMIACRPLKVSPIHDLLVAKGAIFGEIYGWERPNWFAPAGATAGEEYSFHRPNYVDHVAQEHAAARKGTVLYDISHDAKFRVSGVGAAEILADLLTGELPQLHRRAVQYALTDRGTFRAKFAVFREAADAFILTGAPGSERSSLDLLRTAVSSQGCACLENLTGREGAIVVSGLDVARALAELSCMDIVDMSAEDMSDEGFPVGTGRKITVGYAPALAIRTDVFGRPAWELHCGSEFLRHVFAQVASALPSARLIGARALEALRLSAGQPAFGTELGPTITLAEAGFGGASDKRLVLIEVLGQPSSAPLGAEPLRDSSGLLVGETTSGGIDHVTGCGVAFAFVDNGHAQEGSALKIRLLGEWHPATVRLQSSNAV
jgi:dimethylglycine dehydrogenase